MSTLENLKPANMTSVGNLMPVSFSVQSVGTVTAFVAIWLRYADTDDEILVHDGTDFQYPFAPNSTVERPLGNDDLINFSIIPEFGWLRAIDSFRVQGNPAIV